MGQYYYPISLDKKQFILSHDCADGGDFVGLKLMEHSYIGNPMVNVVEHLLMPGGEWYKSRLVWAGDYADGEPDLEKDENGETPNLHCIIGDDDNNKIIGDLLLKNLGNIPEEYCYVVNHSLKQFVDKRKIKKNDWGGKIHPLPLLVSEGNGRGGGDFHGEDERIGFWARHIISIEKEIPEGYEEIDGQFIEE